MNSPYHDGERDVQERAGVRALSDKIGRTIGNRLPPGVASFLQQLPFLFVTAVGHDGKVWSTILAGRPGFARAEDDRTLNIAALPVPADPVSECIESDGAVSILAIDPLSRTRFRFNGRVNSLTDVSFVVRIDEAYGNCPKYIQARQARWSHDPLATDTSRGDALTETQTEWIEAADTFFIASFHHERGADASHRGGLPGFVRVIDERTLAFPDYQGNNMFQTLGNIEVDPRTGLLFVDFTSGSTVQLSGTASVDWGPQRALGFPGAQRVVDYRVEQVVEIAHAVPLRWQLVEYSRYNPR